MDKYVTQSKRKTGDAFETNKTKRSARGNQPKSNIRKCDESYLALGFTVIVSELKTLAADTVRRNKLKRHLEMTPQSP